METEDEVGFLVGQVASLAGVTVKAVRHYEKLGLVSPSAREANGYKRYAADAVVRVAGVAALARSGVPLARAGAILDGAPSAATSIEVVLDVLRDERDRIELQLATLGSLAAAMATGEGQLEELGRPLVEDVKAALGDARERVSDDVWRIERRVVGLLGSFGAAGAELPEPARDYIRSHAEEIAAALEADAALAGLRDVSPDSPIIEDVVAKLRDARSVVAPLLALLGRPGEDARAGVRSVVRPRLSAAQLAALQAAAGDA